MKDGCESEKKVEELWEQEKEEERDGGYFIR